MSEIVARKTRKLGPKWPNTVNRRMTKIGDSTKFAAAWTDADGNALASLEVESGRAQIKLVGSDGLVVDGTGGTLQEAYRAAWHEMRVERARRNVEQLLEERARRRRTVTSLIRSVNEAYALSASQMTELDRRGRAIKRLEEENTALKAQLDKACHATIDGFDINHWYRQASAAEARAQQWKNTVDRLKAEQGGEAYKPVTFDTTAEAAQEATS